MSGSEVRHGPEIFSKPCLPPVHTTGGTFEKISVGAFAAEQSESLWLNTTRTTSGSCPIMFAAIHSPASVLIVLVTPVVTSNSQKTFFCVERVIFKRLAGQQLLFRAKYACVYTEMQPDKKIRRSFESHQK